MLIQGDAARIPLPDQSVHCVVTSPPYWGLRKYAGEQGRGLFPNLGLEKTPQEHIEHLVEIMREVRRVLRDDGVVWLNYGDCFSGGGRGGQSEEKRSENWQPEYQRIGTPIPQGNLLLMPHRIAIALQDDGWIIRNDLVWWKRNPMPESVAGWRWERRRKKVGRIEADWRDLSKGWDVGTGSHDEIGKGNYRNDDGRERTIAQYEYGDDYILRHGSWRHTRAHEYVFMLCKKMSYYCNQEAVREEATGNRWGGNVYTPPEETKMNDENTRGLNRERDMFASGRNPRSVLDVPTSPYSGAHYATFPPDLIAPLIRTSCPRRCCPECGQAWAPVVEKDFIKTSDGRANTTGQDFMQGWEGIPRGNPNNQVLDYRPTCSCGHENYVPGIVLDPFVGSGTTVMVAKQLLRRGIGLDISMEYLDEQAKVRTGVSSPSNQFNELPLFTFNGNNRDLEG